MCELQVANLEQEAIDQQTQEKEEESRLAVAGCVRRILDKPTRKLRVVGAENNTAQGQPAQGKNIHTRTKHEFCKIDVKEEIAKTKPAQCRSAHEPSATDFYQAFN